MLLEDVKHYSSGASAEIRVAIQQPSNKDAQRGALDILSKLVIQIRAYYELSQRIEQIVPLLLWDLCSGILFLFDSKIIFTRFFSNFLKCVRIKEYIDLETEILQVSANDPMFFHFH